SKSNILNTEKSNTNDSESSNSPSTKEYRLVPVDEWAEAEKGAGEEQSVDVKALAETVWDKRRFVFKVTGIFIIIGILIILLSPVEYKAEATLLSEDQSSLPMGGLLQQFGGMLGLGKIMQSQKENLSPELYTEIVNSVPFQVQLLNREV